VTSVSALWRYPVKSCAGVRLEQAEVGIRGFVGDRRWMLVNPEGGHVTQREIGALARLKCSVTKLGISFADGPSVPTASAVTPARVTIWEDAVDALEASEEVSLWVSSRVGSPLRLVYMSPASVRVVSPGFSKPGDEVSFADGFPILVASEASLAHLNRRMGTEIPMLRFRPNVVVRGCDSFAEDTWRRIRVGSIVLDVVKPCARCVVVDTDPQTGIREKGILSALAKFRRADNKVFFGQNAIPRGIGTIRLDDPVEILEIGPPNPAF
jgi:MOSC domain-containing protein